MATRPVMHFLRLQGFPILQQLQLEERLLRTTSLNWCLINQGTSPPAIVMGISGYFFFFLYSRYIYSVWCALFTGDEEEILASVKCSSSGHLRRSYFICHTGLEWKSMTKIRHIRLVVQEAGAATGRGSCDSRWHSCHSPIQRRWHRDRGRWHGVCNPNLQGRFRPCSEFVPSPHHGLD